MCGTCNDQMSGFCPACSDAFSDLCPCVEQCNCIDGWVLMDDSGNELTQEEFDALPEDERMKDNCPVCNEGIIVLKMGTVNKFGDNGIIEKIIPGNPFPLFVKFENGSAWQNLNHIKEVL